MNENSFTDLDNNSSIRLLRSSPALPDFRAGELPARIFFARLKTQPTLARCDLQDTASPSG
jgi:hypothetical protein